MGENSAWTIDAMIDSSITKETKIRLKPNYTSIKDFTCYGSANKLVQGTVNGVIMDFPAELYFSDEVIKFYKADSGKTGYSTNEENALSVSNNMVYNEYDIDITNTNIRPESVYNPLRYFTLCGSSYVLIDKNGEEHAFTSFSATTTAMGRCSNGKAVEVDKIAKVWLNFEGMDTISIDVYKDYTDGSVYYLYDGSVEFCHIRPKKQIIEQYFLDIDDFTAVLLDRTTNPIYRSCFETPKETDTGYFYDMVDYVWPSFNGGFNPDLSGPYYSYLQSLIDLADFYDEFFTDNMWRSLTHEAIKTLDWTYVSNSDGDIEEMSAIDTSRVEPITKIYGRQFDDLKRYADGIKSINTITYNQKSNTPDYTLTDVLENSGWETKTLKITTDRDVCTETLYPAMSTGYTASDANSEFFRRLKLNSGHLLSSKGTRKGLDSMLALFGFSPEDYDIHEYVYVASSNGDFTRFCESTNELPEENMPKFPLAKDVATINKYKINFNPVDPYGDYCGIPVAEIGHFVQNESDTANPYNYSYVVPWFSYGKKYDDGLYFQMNGGWGNRSYKKIELDIAPEISAITEGNGVSLYDETQARLKFASDFDELLQQAGTHSQELDVFYVTDISNIVSEYSFGPDEASDTGCSHYFVLENPNLYQFLGYSYCGTTAGSFGWRNIKTREIEENVSAGTLVLYLESIKDDTTGNNPHVGNGTYDGGSSYLTSMSNIFGYSLDKQNFIGIDDGSCVAIAGYKFDLTREEDNRKCWFFSDDYETEEKRNGDTVTLLDGNVTGEMCSANTAISDIIELLGTPETNKNSVPPIGSEAEEYFMKDTESLYTRGSDLSAFVPEVEGENNGEAAANTVINVKDIIINFNLTEQYQDAVSSSAISESMCGEEEFKERMTDYINETVIPYLTQMIPSTAIVSWSLDGDNTASSSGGVIVPVNVTGKFEQGEPVNENQ